jgi:hypothetical protein
VSAAAASFFSGGIVSLGTMLAVFLSTSDELLPVLISNKVSFSLLGKIVLLKFLFAAAIGVAVDFISRFFKLHRREVAIHEICEHSRCSCGKHRGVIVPALIHTVEVFVFILLISGAVELAFHYFGEPSLSTRIPLVGEFISGFFGLVPNCAISVASAELYCKGVISAGQLMACSFTSSGVGLLVLFRTNRSFKENLSVVFAVYVFGSILGILSGLFF